MIHSTYDKAKTKLCNFSNFVFDAKQLLSWNFDVEQFNLNIYGRKTNG